MQFHEIKVKSLQKGKQCREWLLVEERSNTKNYFKFCTKSRARMEWGGGENCGHQSVNNCGQQMPHDT